MCSRMLQKHTEEFTSENCDGTSAHRTATVTELCASVCASKKAGISLERRCVCATQRLSAHSRRSSTVSGRCDPPTTETLEVAAVHEMDKAKVSGL